jgi:hypothetical protein
MIYANLPNMSPSEARRPDAAGDEPVWSPPQFSLLGIFGLISFVSVILAVVVTPGYTALFVLGAFLACWLVAQIVGVRRVLGIPVRKVTGPEWLVLLAIWGVLVGLKMPAKTSRPNRPIPAVAPGALPPATSQPPGGQ